MHKQVLNRKLDYLQEDVQCTPRYLLERCIDVF